MDADCTCKTTWVFSLEVANTMDRTSFLALFKATCGDVRQDKHPSLVMGILVYLLGLGYEVQLSGRDAEEYIARSCGVGLPFSGGDEADTEKGARGQSLSLSPARVAGSVNRVDWSSMEQDETFSFVLDAEHPSVQGLSENPVCLVDQLHVRIHLGRDALVHCGRHIFSIDGTDGNNELVETFDAALDALISQQHTMCTVGRSSEGIFTMETSSFVDDSGSTFHGLKNIDTLLSVLTDGLCKCSSRSAGTMAGSRRGNTHASSSAASIAYEGRDTRVGYADMNPVNPQGAGQGLGPGGMMVGPHHPIFGRGRLEPPEGHEGNLPPGARWDPIGPPGTQGFFPGDFQRRTQTTRDVHPDIMQPGRSQSPDWM